MGFREFIDQAVRVLKLARKPTWDEIKRTAKITGLGIVILGLIGYVIHWGYYIITTYIIPWMKEGGLLGA